MLTKLHALFLLFFFSMSAGLFAQPLNRAYQGDFFSFSSVIEPVGPNRWLVGGESGAFYGFPGFAPLLMLIDSAGAVVWQKKINQIQGTELGLVSDIVLTGAGEFYVTGLVSGCDYFLPGFLAKYDLAGNQIYTQTLEEPATTIGLLPGGDLLLGAVGYDKFYRYDVAEEAIVWENNTSLSGNFAHFQDLAVLDSLRSYILTSEQLLRIDNVTGEVVSALELADGIQLLASPTDASLLALTADQLFRLDPTLTILDQLPLSTLGNFDLLKRYGDELYVLGRDANNDALLLMLDDNLMIQEQQTLLSAYYQVKDFNISDQQVTLLGNEYPEPSVAIPNYSIFNNPFAVRGSNMFVRTLMLGDTPATNPLDVALTNFELSGLPAREDLGFSCERVIFPNIQVTLENTGTTVLKEVQINARFTRCQGICNSAFTYSFPQTNLALAPGDSLVVSLGNLTLNGIPIPETDEIELCFWLSLPNQQIDAVPDNDISCQSYIVTGINTPVLPVVATLTPNPFDQWLTLEFQTPLEKDLLATVFNTLGQRLHSAKIASGRTRVEQNLGHLASGIYWLHLSDGVRQKTVKFIKK